MPPDITLRRATDADVAALASLYAACVEDGAGLFEDRCDPATLSRYLGALIAENVPFLVAEGEADGVEIVGCAYAGRYQPGAGFAHCVQSSIWIHPARRSQGLGWALLRDLLIGCRQAGYRQIIAYLRADSEPALSLHASLGFTVIGWHRDACQAFGASHDVVAMRRVLDRIGPTSETVSPRQPHPARMQAAPPAHRATPGALRGLAARLSLPVESSQ